MRVAGLVGCGAVASAGAYRTVFAAADALPLVFDSPHSGSALPESFGAAQPPDILSQAEDSYVDELLAGVPEHGATLIAAEFRRAFIDVNRALYMDESTRVRHDGFETVRMDLNAIAADIVAFVSQA